MDKIIKEKWVAALRSGKYTQIRHRLRVADTNNVCAMGCLIDILDGWNFREATGAWPEYAKAGLTENIVRVITNKNDEDGKSFREIADYIEKNL